MFRTRRGFTFFLMREQRLPARGHRDAGGARTCVPGESPALEMRVKHEAIRVVPMFKKHRVEDNEDWWNMSGMLVRAQENYLEHVGR